MAKKQKIDKEKPAEPVLVRAAEAIGRAAGKIAALVGARPEAPTAKSMKKPKLPKRDKHRIPRRQKKAQQKAAGPRT
jgi:hypothetical protein